VQAVKKPRGGIPAADDGKQQKNSDDDDLMNGATPDTALSSASGQTDSNPDSEEVPDTPANRALLM
jgi:hypothetical protein